MCYLALSALLLVGEVLVGFVLHIAVLLVAADFTSCSTRGKNSTLEVVVSRNALVSELAVVLDWAEYNRSVQLWGGLVAKRILLLEVALCLQ